MKLSEQTRILRPLHFAPSSIHNLPPSPSLITEKDQSSALPLPEAEDYRTEIEAHVLSRSPAPSLPINYFHLQHDIT